MSFRDRIVAAWHAFLDRPWTPEQVRRMAHRIGMHRGADYECPECFAEQFACYLAVCDEILIGIDLVDDIMAFRCHMQQMADVLDPAFLLHEHPAYAIADYLRIDPDSPAFGPIIETAARIMAGT